MYYRFGIHAHYQFHLPFFFRWRLMLPLCNTYTYILTRKWRNCLVFVWLFNKHPYKNFPTRIRSIVIRYWLSVIVFPCLFGFVFFFFLFLFFFVCACFFWKYLFVLKEGLHFLTSWSNFELLQQIAMCKHKYWRIIFLKLKHAFNWALLNFFNKLNDKFSLFSTLSFDALLEKHFFWRKTFFLTKTNCS